MRITTNMSYQSSMKALQKASERLDTASEQMASGDKFKTSGEDPTGMAQKLSLTSKITAYQQYNTNGSLLDSSLSLEGTVLDSVVTSIQSAQTLVQRSVNGTLSAEDKKSIASELTELQNQLFDLMNTKNADGEYIFAGNLTQTSAFALDSNGEYIFQGDNGQRSIQVSPGVQIAENDSGLTVFQQVATRRTAAVLPAVSPLLGNGLSIELNNQSDFDSFYKSNYDFDPSATNQFTLETIAGTPETYTITDSNSTVIQSGSFTLGEAINFNGLSLTTNGIGSQDFQLAQPENDNILNTLTTMINALSDSDSLTDDEWNAIVADTEVHLTNTLDKVNKTLGAIGGRQNNLDEITNTNSALQTISTEARATVSEVDLYEVVSQVSQEQNALSMAQTAFAKVNQSTLFDYI